jgi:NADPH-dependent glutamate synthase beta subunit-like oxidoreductase
MKYFEHTHAGSFEEAQEILSKNNEAAIIAGGTDLLCVLKDDILDRYPGELVDIKQIPGSAAIEVKDGVLSVGALAKLNEVVGSELVREHAPLLSEAAKSVATPLIRNIGTIGGNLCQDVRCWYYRYPHEGGGRLVCKRKGGEHCYAEQGDNRYHTIFGGMKCGSTACTRNCPAATDIPAYMEQIRLGNIDGAAQIIMNVNPMPAITSRVCAHFCQDDCNHAEYGDSVAIRNVERFVGDYALENKNKFFRAPTNETGKRVAIVGSGPSGLTAAYYLREAGNEVTVYDSKEEPGGMLMYAIPDYRLPKEIVRKYTDALSGMGIVFVCGTKVGEDVSPSELEKDFDSVYYATGTWKRPVLGLAGEELTVFGLDFLVQVHDWMDGKVGQEVLVTGGGNVAMDVAITAKRLGAVKVTLACLETEDIMPAGKEEIARAKEEGIEIMPGWGLSRVVESDGVVTGMELVKCLSVFDEGHRFNPVYDKDEKVVVNAENILMAVGQSVDLSFLDEKYQLQLTARGLIDVEEETQMTSREGVFAGGDATTGPSTAIQCVANGHKAARGINNFLGVDFGHDCIGKQSPVAFLTFDVEGVKEAKGLKLEEIPLAKRSIDTEDEIAPDQTAALTEAKRCMNCGCYAVNPSDIAPALVALDASIVTNMRRIPAEEFSTAALKVSDQLQEGEIVKSIEIPIVNGAVQHYDKFRLRDSVDFAIVSLSSLLGVENGKISGAKFVFGGVAPVPIVATEVEGYLVGKEVSAATADAAAELAVKSARPLENNKYKMVELKALVKQAILRIK